MSGQAVERLKEAPLQRVVVTDTIPSASRLEALGDKLERLTVAKLL